MPDDDKPRINEDEFMRASMLYERASIFMNCAAGNQDSDGYAIGVKMRRHAMQLAAKASLYDAKLDKP